MKTQTGQTVFDLKNGDRVYDTVNNSYGRVSKVIETQLETIEAFVLWDNTDREEKLKWLPNYKIVGE